MLWLADLLVIGVVVSLAVTGSMDVATCTVAEGAALIVAVSAIEAGWRRQIGLRTGGRGGLDENRTP